jgi:hypothetical protein
MPPTLDVERAATPARADRRPLRRGWTLPAKRQDLLVLLLFGLVELALLGSHVVHGGMYADDWPLSAIQRRIGTSGLFGNLAAGNHERPLGFIYQTVTTAISGTSLQLHAMWGPLTLFTAVVALYFLLKALLFATADAVCICLLFLIFPFSDGSWLWYAASHGYLAIALAAFGGVVAVKSTRYDGRPGIVSRLCALLLFAASVLTYQTAALVICLSILAYRSRVPPRKAVLLWLSDVGTVALALFLPRLVTGSAGNSVPDKIIPLADQVDHARLMANQGLTLLADVLVPFGSAHRDVVLPVALALLLGGIFIARASDPGLRRQARRWLAVVAGGILVIATAYAIYVPAPINFYEPLARGTENRVNIAAAFGYVVVVYALAMIGGTIVVRVLRWNASNAAAVALVIVIAVFTGYAIRTRGDIASWDRATAIQRHELSALRTLGKPAPDTTIYTFEGVGDTAPGVPAFRSTWDLNSAVQLLWNDPSLDAYPIFIGTQMECTADQVLPNGLTNGDGIAQAASYGHAVFYDLRTGQRRLITNLKICRRAVGAFVAGPVEA